MAKAKTNSKKKTTTRKKTQQKKQTNFMQTDLFKICLFLCLIVIGIVAMLKLGVVGGFLFHFFSFFVGNLTYVALIAMVLICGFLLLTQGESDINARYIVGMIFLMMAWLLLQSALEFKPEPCASGIKTIFSNTLSIWLGDYLTKGGLFGAILLAVFGSLFDYVGAYLFVLLFAVIGGILIGFDWILQLIEEQKDKKKEQPAPVAKQKKKRIEINYDPYEQYDPYDDLDYVDAYEPGKKSPFLEYDPAPFDVKEKDSIFMDVDPIDEPKKKRRTRTRKTVEVEPQVEEVYDFQPVQEKPKKQEEPKVEEVHQPATYLDNADGSFENYRLPRLTILDPLTRKGKQNANNQNARVLGERLIEVLSEFGVDATLSGVRIGPTVTRFEIKPAMGIRVSRIANLQDDIKYALAAREIRIEAPIPGKSAVGIEIPNSEKSSVQMIELMKEVKDDTSPLTFVLGKDLNGDSVYGKMDKMPHLLIAGATGSGKSVCVNSIICSYLLRTRPDEVKLILIDPKKVEFTPYNDVPHLLAPVITDADMANKALKVVVTMMDHRYDLFGQLGVRNIDGYNAHVAAHPEDSLKPLPRLVVIIDELADLMLVAAKEVEASIQRITQLARAAGIHLIVATQRPSVDVITGVIKANIPSRIAFAVSSAIDSRTILDQAGAEKLLGYGDMLYLPNGETSPKRIQGVFIKDDEVNRIAEYVKNQAKPHYDDSFIQLKDIASQGGMVAQESADPLYNEVKNFVIQSRKASTSLVQRRFSIGYSRAARLIDCLEENGIVGPANGSKPREILVQNTLEDDYSDVY